MARTGLLKTKRLIIRPFTEKYLTERYVGWLNDPVVVKFSDQRHKRHTLKSCRKYMESFNKSPNYFWAIVAKDKALGHIGNTNAYIDPVNKSADVGILLGERSAWGQGFALEAWQVVCDYLLHKKNIFKVTAGTLSVNTRMLNLMKRTGMIKDERPAGYIIFKGRKVSIIHMALFKNMRKLHHE